MKKIRNSNPAAALLALFIWCFCLSFNQAVYGAMLSQEEILSVTQLHNLFLEKKDHYEKKQLDYGKINGQLEADIGLLKKMEEAKQNAKQSYLSLQKLDIEHPEFALEEQLSMKRSVHKEASSKVLEKKAEISRQESQMLALQADLQRAEMDFKDRKGKYHSYIQTLAKRYTKQKLYSMQQNVVVAAEATVFCGDDVTPRDCRKKALAKADRKALEQGSVIVVESITEVKNFQLSYDEVHSEFKAKLSNRKILTDTPAVGQHTISISTEVTPMMTSALKESINSSASLEFQHQLRQVAKEIVYLPPLADEAEPPAESKKRGLFSTFQPSSRNDVSSQIEKEITPKASSEHISNNKTEPEQHSENENGKSRPIALPNF